MTALSFPKMFTANKVTTVDGIKATEQNLRLILLSKVKEFFGDPEYGPDLVKDLFEFNGIQLPDIAKDQICTTVLKYMPQLQMTKDDVKIVQKDTQLFISFHAHNLDTQSDDMYNISLTQNS